MKLRKYYLITVLSVLNALFVLGSSAQNSLKDTLLIPLSTVFYDIGPHVLGSFTYNYGLNYLVAGAATYGLVQGGTDWRWYRNAQDHKWISNAGFISVVVGPIASVAVPLGLYLYGRSNRDVDMQITGLAIGQAAILGAVISSCMKAFTGRPGPELNTNKNDNSKDFRFGFLSGGIYHGWPSSHTTTAFAMAATVMELYPEKTAVKIGGLAYASLIGVGVSTNIHWLSDVVAGALIGYAIGTTVGISYRKLMTGMHEEPSYDFYFTPSGSTFSYRF